MFSGSWKESNQSRIILDIPDMNITKEGWSGVKRVLFITQSMYVLVCTLVTQWHIDNAHDQFQLALELWIMIVISILGWFVYFYVLFSLPILFTRIALNVAFSSLYRDEFPLDETQMCSIVAASSMLQLVCNWELRGRCLRSHINLWNLWFSLFPSRMASWSTASPTCSAISSKQPLLQGEASSLHLHFRPDSVVGYLTAASMYGLTEVEEE